MSKDIGDVIGTAIGRVARETVQSVAQNHKRRGGPSLGGGKGLAAGAGLATLAPLAFKGAKGVKGLVNGSGDGSGPIGKAKEKLEGDVKDKAKQGAKDALPFGGGKGKGEEGVGKGRRMPIQQSMDIPLDVQTVYNEWTQFEEWPTFMHRLESVSQDDDATVKFKAKIWGKSKEFSAKIVEQRPDDYIKWKVEQGLTHTGAVAFREIAPGLTRVEVNMDVQPGSLLEKAARGMRHIKRAVRADLHRFKAHVMMAEEESGAWRGTIDDGDVKRRTEPARSRSSSRSSSASRSPGSSSRSGSASSRSRSGGSSKSSGSSSRSGNGSSKSSGASSRSRSGGASKSSGSSKSGGSSKSSGSSSRSGNGSSKSTGGASRSRSGGASKSSGSSSRSGNGSSRASSSRASSNGRSSSSRSRSSANGRKTSGARS